ncbi:MAG: type II toxin-antitoxin system RelE/ParE family toxin [Leptolyngbyaceae cyanobacterium RM1_406_9]|nr:type II toxin-antitoxin system RelE/ParE family toxin [Leptolyngbyaceae cyanobacterium RM1_406_9]
MQIDPPIQVLATARFENDLRLLKKRYRNILTDVQPVVKQLQMGDLPGDQVAGVGYPIFKVRIRNRDAQRGKSGGYRLLYYLKSVQTITLITIYSKSDQGDIAITEIQDILIEFNQIAI